MKRKASYRLLQGGVGIGLSAFFSLSFAVMSPVPLSNECASQVSNFSSQSLQSFSIGAPVKGWGPRRSPMSLESNANLAACAGDSQSGITWQQQRVLAAADFWVAKKLNYCHHYTPDYATPLALRGAQKWQGGYCSAALSIMPNSFYFQQQARWNYSGQGDETAANWVKTRMWYGVDCSNFTSFIYNFALGKQFNSNTAFQSGQRHDQSQDHLSPNTQTGLSLLDNPEAAGKLVCMDNSLEVNHSCVGHGGYLTAIDGKGQLLPSGSVTADALSALPLYPGDLLFIAGGGVDTAPDKSDVTHVVMWTGKKIGYGPEDILPSKIAPNSLCPQEDWMPKVGQWVIVDSHYQGPDYRALTPCFYLNHLWGVRRVIQ